MFPLPQSENEKKWKRIEKKFWTGRRWKPTPTGSVGDRVGQSAAPGTQNNTWVSTTFIALYYSCVLQLNFLTTYRYVLYLSRRDKLKYALKKDEVQIRQGHETLSR